MAMTIDSTRRYVKKWQYQPVDKADVLSNMDAELRAIHAREIMKTYRSAKDPLDVWDILILANLLIGAYDLPYDVALRLCREWNRGRAPDIVLQEMCKRTRDTKRSWSADDVQGLVGLVLSMATDTPETALMQTQT